MMLPEKNDRSFPVRTLIFLWILRHEPLAGLGFMASLYYIGESRKGHGKIKVRTGHDKELHGFIGFSDSIITPRRIFMNMRGWQFFAFGSAFFAGLTAILGKVGVQGINSNLGMFIRTVVVLAMTALILTFRGQWAKTEGLNT